MKVRDTSPGRLYALSSEIGCTAINGAMAVDIPAGGQVVVLALAKKIVIDGDDAAKFVEVRWGTNTVVGSRPAPAWLSDVLSGLISIVGDDNFDINYIPAENKLVVHTDRVDDTQFEAVTNMLKRFVPGFIEVVQYNHNMEISWRDINKYAECVTLDDLIAVNPDYNVDFTSDGEWVYPVPALMNITGENKDGSSFRGAKELKKWSVPVPNLKSAGWAYKTSGLTEWTVGFPAMVGGWGSSSQVFLEVLSSVLLEIYLNLKWPIKCSGRFLI